MPFLISVKALELSYPGVTIDPIDHESPHALNAANGSPLELVGSGHSVQRTKDGKWAMMGPVMQYWYPACATVFQDLSTPFIMSASLLCTHMMQIS